MKPGNFLESMNCAVEGIIHALKTERHLQVHFAATLIVIIVALAVNVSVTDFILLCIVIAVVIAAELLNTAVERTADLFAPEFRVDVKQIKDVAAGAVFFVSMFALFSGLIIFSRYISTGPSGSVSESGFILSVISLSLVGITIFGVKAYFRAGRPFYGGMPSGHAAVSFSLVVSLFQCDAGYIALAAATIAAFIVSFSRFYLHIHKKNEVLCGALVGIVITYLVFALFGQ